jgi:CHRD domain/PEP-CTERM motif
MTSAPRIAAAFVLLAASMLMTGAAHAVAITFPINATGAEEVTAAGVPNQGDLDGSAIGTITLDEGAGGATGSATFNLLLANLDFDFTGHHIHQAPATTTGPIVLDFGDPNTILSGSTLLGTITGLPSATIAAVFANPSGFYYNLHNTPFPSGAVRDQLAPVPEPAIVWLVGSGLVGLAAVVRYGRRRDR